MTRGELVAAIARSCAVEIHIGGFRGSGFLVAAGTVITCAHVVRDHAAVTVRWNGADLPATVERVLPPAPDGGPYWPFPDLAVIRLDEPPADHPVAWLDPEPVRSGDVLVAHGFSTKTPTAGPAADGLRVVVATTADRYTRIKDDRIVAGLSGSLVVNERTGLVAGVVKASRDQGTTAGGWIVPSAEVADLVTATDPGPWRAALMAPLRSMFEGQTRTSQTLPYRVLGGPLPALSQVYVRQRAKDRVSAPVDIAVALRDPALLLVGAPGAGKSSLALHVCGETARWWLDPSGDPPYGLVVAVRVPASALVDGTGFTDMVAAAVSAELGGYLDRPLSPSVFEEPPVPGVPWLIIVDGVDEVLDADRRSQLLATLDARVREADPARRFMVTTRPLREDVAVGTRYDLLPFDRPRMHEFVEAWFTTRGPENAARSTASFLGQITGSRLAEVVEVPLLLTIAVMVFEQDPDHRLPDDLPGLYEAFVRVLLAKTGTGDPQVLQRLAQWQDLPAAVRHHLVHDRHAVLQRIAYRWFFDSSRPLTDLVREVLGPNRPTGGLAGSAWHEFARVWLLETGLVTANGADLAWLHVSFAEFLASRELITHPLRDWIWLASTSTTTNIARLGLATVLRTSGPPRRLWNRLIRDGAGGDFLAQDDLISDALVLSMCRRTFLRVLAGMDSRRNLTVFTLRQVAMDWLGGIMSNPRWPVHVRQLAAFALRSRMREAMTILLDMAEDGTLPTRLRESALQLVGQPFDVEVQRRQTSLRTALTIEGRYPAATRIRLAGSEDGPAKAMVYRRLWEQRVLPPSVLLDTAMGVLIWVGNIPGLIDGYRHRRRWTIVALRAAAALSTAIGLAVLVVDHVYLSGAHSVALVAVVDVLGLAFIGTAALAATAAKALRDTPSTLTAAVRDLAASDRGSRLSRDESELAVQRLGEIVGHGPSVGVTEALRRHDKIFGPSKATPRRPQREYVPRPPTRRQRRQLIVTGLDQGTASVHAVQRDKLGLVTVQLLARDALAESERNPRRARPLLELVLADRRVRLLYGRRIRARLEILGGLDEGPGTRATGARPWRVTRR